MKLQNKRFSLSQSSLRKLKVILKEKRKTFNSSFFVDPFCVPKKYTLGTSTNENWKGNIFPSQLPFLLQQKLFFVSPSKLWSSSYFICFNLFSFPRFLYLIFHFIYVTKEKVVKCVLCESWVKVFIRFDSISWFWLLVRFCRAFLDFNVLKRLNSSSFSLKWYFLSFHFCQKISYNKIQRGNLENFIKPKFGGVRIKIDFNFLQRGCTKYHFTIQIVHSEISVSSYPK